MRIFVFGIDGLTMRIMKPLMDKGLIPNFKSIYENSSKGILKSTIPPLTPPSWASIYTGKNPGKHGLFEFRERKGYIFTINSCWDYNEAPPVWKYLSDSGKKCILLNIPFYYPPLRLQNCISISGFPMVETMNIYHPESLKREIINHVPHYKVDSHWKGDLPRGKEEAFIRENIEVTKSRIKTLKYLMKSKPWDFFFAVFTGADRMQHFFWNEIVNGETEVCEYYMLLDETIGYVLDSLKRDDFFFIVSDHGFSPVYIGVNISKVLQQHKLLSVKKTIKFPINYWKFKRFIENLGIGDTLRNILPRKFIVKFQEITNVEGLASFSKIDWFHTKAFPSSGLFGGIGINLKNREPRGIVSEVEYELVRDKIVEIFSSLTNNNGERVIRNVYKREELYFGKHLHKMPDLVLIAEVGSKFDETIDGGDIFRELRDDKEHCLTRGEHEVESILIFKHDSFNKEFKEVSVTDIAPSVLNIFRIPVPTSMDGKSLFEDYTPLVYIDELTGISYTKQEGKPLDIKARLKNLH